MTRSVFVWFLALLLTGAFLFGCSGAGDIVSPDPGGGQEAVKEAASPDGTFSRYLWDLGEVVINTAEGTVDVVRHRTADVNVNVVKFMQPSAMPNAISYHINWPQSTLAQGIIDVDVTMEHPFDIAYYWGHDVRFIIIGNGTEHGQYDNSLFWAKPSELRMINADGYTRWWNRLEFFGLGTSIFEYTYGELALGAPTGIPSARLNPYKYFADSVAKNDFPPDIDEATRGEFRSGNTNSRHMVLDFPNNPSPNFSFWYAVDASWTDPIHTPVDSTDDFDLNANCREAYQIKVDQTGSTAFWNDAGDNGGDLHLNLEIYDWKQGGGSVEDEIGKVVVESPTLFSNYGGFVDITSLAQVSDGTSENSVVYSYTITNVTPTSNENQEVLVVVESSDPTTYAPPYGSFPYPLKALSAYQLYGAYIEHGTTPKTITVIQPNGGEEWMIGSSETIFWTSTGPIANVKIEYSEDGGGTFPHTIIDITANDGNFTWNPIPDTPTEEGIVRVSEVGNPTVNDVSDAVFSIVEEEKTITVVKPNGGESLEIDGTYDIEWDSTGDITNVKIEYSTDGGGTYPNEITASTPNDGVFTWDPIPDDPTDQAKVRISDASDGAVNDVSDDVFEITATPKNLEVLVPNGGEVWVVGTSHAITWDSEGAITNVKIEYYKDDDYDGTKVVIIASTENDGSYTWDPIPDDPTTTAKVRISDADAAATYDDSDEFFEISSEQPQGWTKTINNLTLNPQPDQGTMPPDISVTDLGDPDFSRPQIARMDGQTLWFSFFSDDYTSVVGEYSSFASEALDMTPFNHFDMTMQYINVLGVTNANTVSPFAQFNDPGHCINLILYNADQSDEYSGYNFGFWIYGDADPEGDIPPNNDPDDQPWIRPIDMDSAVLGGPYGDAVLDDTALFSVLTHSDHPDQPQLNPDGEIFYAWYSDTYSTDTDVILGLAGMVDGGLDPGPIDDSTPDIMRLAVDDNSGLVVGSDPVNAWYVLDSNGLIHIVLLWYDSTQGGYSFMSFDSEYLGAGGDLGIDFGGDAVDICVLPSRLAEYDDWSWLAVLVDTGSGWVIKVYSLDFIGPDPENPELVVTEVHTTEAGVGDPMSMDSDNFQFEMHVIADDGGTYKVTVWQYTEE